VWPSEWSGGPSDIEGKMTRVGASERGQRTSFNRTRVAGHLDEIQGIVANTLSCIAKGAVGFIDWLDVNFPTMNYAANNKATDASKNQNGHILVRDDGVRKANEQAKQQADKPARPAR